jgi:hypothetical protein
MCANHTVMKYLTSPPAVLVPYTHSLHGVHQLQPASVAATCFCARMQDACRPRHTLRLGLRLNLSWQLDLPPAGHPRVHCATCDHTCAPPLFLLVLQAPPPSRLGFRLMQLNFAVALVQHVLPGLSSRPVAFHPDLNLRMCS